MARVHELLPDLKWMFSTDWKSAFFASFIGAVVAIPQAITFSYLVGVPIDHGLICAVVVSLIAALFGNSTMLSGPNTATAIMLGLAVSGMGLAQGELFTQKVMQLTLLIGVLQVLVWSVGAVRVFQFLSKPAISGITMAVGVLIVRAALDKVLGENWFEPQRVSMVIGGATIAAAFLVRGHFKKSWVLLAMVVGMILTFAFDRAAIDFLKPVELSQLSFGWALMGPTSFASWLELLPAAAAIAFISLAQSMVISQDLKNRIDSRISLSRECIALGLGNTVAPFFGAYAGAGSFNRTQVNEELGARGPAAGVLCALMCLGFMTFAGAFLKWIPVAVVAGVLFMVGFKMIKLPLVRKYFESKEEGLTFAVVFTLALAVGVGVATAVALGISIYLQNGTRCKKF